MCFTKFSMQTLDAPASDTNLLCGKCSSDLIKYVCTNFARWSQHGPSRYLNFKSGLQERLVNYGKLVGPTSCRLINSFVRECMGLVRMMERGLTDRALANLYVNMTTKSRLMYQECGYRTLGLFQITNYLPRWDKAIYQGKNGPKKSE